MPAICVTVENPQAMTILITSLMPATLHMVE